MRVIVTAAVACALAAPCIVNAQETGIRVRSVRVLATDPEAIATFYKKAFGMSETRRAADSPTFREIILNSGATPEAARKAKDPDGNQVELVMTVKRSSTARVGPGSHAGRFLRSSVPIAATAGWAPPGRTSA